MRRARKLLLWSACAAALLAPAAAQAEISFEKSFGGSGTDGGRFATPAGVAVNNASGDVYVADYNQNRIQQFNSTGKLIRVWGYDVVSGGPDNKPFANEVDEVRIRATSGSFTLSFKGEETPPLPYNASAGEVQAALNALPAINTGGGSVTVGGGPGSPSGATPYLVTFSGGPLKQTDVELGIEASGLGVPPGTELSCQGGGGDTEFNVPADAIEYQWLAGGAPVPGATEATFTPGAAEEGKAIQCLVTAVFGEVKTMAASTPYAIASPAPATLPPLGPAELAEPEGKPVVESAGGNFLTCHAGAWKRGPETFTYRWYRNGQEIGSPVTSAEATNEYELTAADVAAKAVFQCSVTAANAGGAATSLSDFLESDPKPTTARAATAAMTVGLSGRSSVLTRTNGGAVLESCKPADICKAGVAGGRLGQFDHPRSIAVDNSPGGEHAVYAIDDGNARVQKFNAEGVPLLAFGAGVDESSGADVCTVASGDVCGPGVRASTASAPGFGKWAGSGEFPELGNELSVDGLGRVYVGDARVGIPRAGLSSSRVQQYDDDGNFLAQASISRLTVASIGVSSGGTSYSSLPSEYGGVVRTLPAEFSPSGEGASLSGNFFARDHNAVQVAIDPRNDRILVSDTNPSTKLSVCGGPPVSGHAIREFDPALHEIDCSVPSSVAAKLPEVTGMAVSPAGLLYVAAGASNQVKIFHLPVPSAPIVGAESATNITTQTARLHAQVNPGFEDTAYRVEYGTEPCPAPGCETVEAQSTLYGLKFTDAAISVEGLLPGTTYHYRVIAKNPLGEQAGPDRTFSTFAKVDLTKDPCPNALARKQTKTAGLLDCRAYELASAAFAGGYDVISDLVPGQEPFPASPEAPGRLLYGVKDGGIPNTGSPTNRGIDPYLATRNEDGTWSTAYVGIPADNPFATAPFSSKPTGTDSSLATFSFGGPEICAHCFPDGSSGAPVHLPSGELVQGMAGSLPDPSAQPAGYVAQPLSADGSHLLFGTDAKLEPTANAGGEATIYSRDLSAQTTEVVSTDGSGATLAGAEVGELAVSADGSRTLIGKEVSTDAAGHPRWHLYLHRSGQQASTDLMPGGGAQGAYFDGMNADASRVFLTTADKLIPGEDTDESADIYEAEVDGTGSSSLRLVSVNSDGSPSNSDACTPANEPSSWNSAAAEGKCGALAFAGGAGLASSSGAFYFLSPEALEVGKGTSDQPNLYLVAPGSYPRFVATIDTSLGKPGPEAPTHPLVDSNFGDASTEAVQALSVDQSNGDLYALDSLTSKIYRFKQNGEPHDFSAGPDANTNVLTTVPSEPGLSSAELAVDNSAGALAGDLYATGSEGVAVFAPSGERLGTIDGSGNARGELEGACGVAVSKTAGVLYVADTAGYIWQYTPNAPAGEITDADYTVKGINTNGRILCSLAVDSAGNLYAAKSTDGPLYRYSTAAFATGTPPKPSGTELSAAARAMAIDPLTDELYLDEGDRIAVLNAAGETLETIGAGKLSCGFLGSRGVAVNALTHHVYASCYGPSAVKEFGFQVPPYTPVDNPAVLHATAAPESHSYADFQVTPDGRYAIFASAQPLAEGFDNAAHYEVYRYEAPGAELLCVSCSPSGAQPGSDASLPSHGLGVLADGRVFFNSSEQLTLADTNAKPDAYEWEGGAQRLISTGTSSYPSSMLGASADGADAFFFTRDVLVGEDKNGQAMKVYDARSEGGHFAIPPPPPCAASDECHGPSSAAAAPPSIGTFKGSGGQYGAPAKPPACKSPKVRRRGHCVKPKKHRRHHRAHRRGGSR